jgi:formylmethanofuran dehydrogenase subunit D
MSEVKMLLIAGRSLKQGTGLNMGKDSSEYREAVNTVELGKADMERLGLRAGDAVRLSSPIGSVEVRCRPGDLPEGMAFIAYGPASSVLMDPETYASGMPVSKQIDVTVQPAIGGTTDAN